MKFKICHELHEGYELIHKTTWFLSVQKFLISTVLKQTFMNFKSFMNVLFLLLRYKVGLDSNVASTTLVELVELQ